MTKFRTFLLQVVLFVSCLLIGAAVFNALEYKEDVSIHARENSSKILADLVKSISERYNISMEKMNSTVRRLRKSILRQEREKWENWEFTGSYYFAGTVAFTIGFGHQTPKTTLGQLMVIIYALIATPLTGLMLSSCGERVAEQQRNAVIFLERKIFQREPRHLKVKTIAMNIFVLVLIFVIASLMTKYYYDGWSILEGVYFLWTCLTTVGFGDYIVNDGKPYYIDQPLKTLMLRFNLILLVAGLCQVSCILLSIQNALEIKFVQQVGDTSADGRGGHAYATFESKIDENIKNDVMAVDGADSRKNKILLVSIS